MCSCSSPYSLNFHVGTVLVFHMCHSFCCCYYNNNFFTLGSIWSWGISKIRSIAKKTTKLARMTCHLINKAVMKKNCVEVLNHCFCVMATCFFKFLSNIDKATISAIMSVGDWSSEACRGFHRGRLQPAGAVHDVFCDGKNWEENQITETWQQQVLNWQLSTLSSVSYSNGFSTCAVGRQL